VSGALGIGARSVTADHFNARVLSQPLGKALGRAIGREGAALLNLESAAIWLRHIIAHLRIRNEKIWVEADNTDALIVQQLLDAGIPKQSIVLAFHSPQKRPLTEFAVA